MCFWQHFGSSLQLTPRLLVPEALWTESDEVMPVPPPDDFEVTAVLARTLRTPTGKGAEAPLRAGRI